ncbi:MAG: transglycosylase SLT domain-containing protein [Thermoleophilaceae bacterium]
MPSPRRLACVAFATALLALPAAAQADSDPATGGAIPPELQQPTGAVPGAPTGGVSPTPPAQPHKKHKKKKPTKPPQPQPTPSDPATADVPADYLRIYKAAGAWQGVSWRLLAAIGKNESDHGRSMAPGVHSGLNFANCCAGPMQICKVASCGKTWQAYAVDVDGDGKWSVYDPEDAIYGAARLVHDLQTMFGDHAALILAGYNAGPGNVMHYDGVPPFAETRAYVDNGIAYMVRLGGHPHR